MVLVGHSQRLAEPLTRRQRRAMAAFGVFLLLAVVAAGILSVYDKNGNPPVSRDGCISVLVASSTGGQPFRRCGAQARTLCRTEYARHDQFAAEVQPQCRLAGIKPSQGQPG